ncbi:hypothetical protein SARC_07332 [Sphaeroforma arctica JP610]|uniref:Uncharacterized protein n=1 Tax=Sphaeroforma arctica JP610 TaxID=667725 RepID=A0A0L0FUH8_9EUKA|nr:hypothetical protein SARC_07332 [Sphaeroforma arctica JP610]KNC80319.1 hypothetical protein SARC_07332 [Sphaeroforma arctica JP610]|eukprot:XP_014154221.1 hypothetical protein SARC_07332 [Sphaeroforma arctica JP610]
MRFWTSYGMRVLHSTDTLPSHIQASTIDHLGVEVAGKLSNIFECVTQPVSYLVKSRVERQPVSNSSDSVRECSTSFLNALTVLVIRRYPSLAPSTSNLNVCIGMSHTNCFFYSGPVEFVSVDDNHKFIIV